MEKLNITIFHWILNIWISLGAKFYFKQTILNLDTKSAPKGFLGSKTEKMNTTIESCIFKLV